LSRVEVVRAVHASGTLTADTDRNTNPVIFSTDNPDSGYSHQWANSVRVTGSAGYTPANSVLFNPTSSAGGVQTLTQKPGDASPARTTAFGYNAANQLTSVTDAAGDVTTYGYTSAGDLYEIISPDGHYTYFVYDSSLRVTEVAQWDGHRYSMTFYNYSTPGHTIVTDPDGHPPINYTIDSN
jgi:YD repeat-containing protein